MHPDGEKGGKTTGNPSRKARKESSTNVPTVRGTKPKQRTDQGGRVIEGRIPDQQSTGKKRFGSGSNQSLRGEHERVDNRKRHSIG